LPACFLYPMHPYSPEPRHTNSIMSTQRLSPASFLKLSQDVALFYGFRPLREVERSLPAGTLKRGAHNFSYASQALAHGAARGEPAMAYYASASPLHLPHGLGLREIGEFGLQVAGAQESVGEVLLLKTVATILSEWGGGVARVRLNALGDKDSRMRFARELSAYLRRQSHNLPPAWRERAAQDPMAFYICTEEACRAVAEQAPRAMSFLSEKSRAHFKEVLEHLEHLGLPYELDDSLVGDEREPRIIFAIDAGEDATVAGSLGGRFDDHVRRLTNRKDATAVHASLYFRKKGLSPQSFVLDGGRARPRLYFVQLGLRAKLRGLEVSNMLRAARIPVLQSFDSSRLTPQLAAATAAGVSHLIIMGQREALDGTVIVRAADNSAQTTLTLPQLPRYLKTLH
jgi:histidyl-tRNA synthetase